MPYYVVDVSLTGIDLSVALLALAHRRAAELGRHVDLRLGDAQALEFGDSAVDTVVCTFALCTIPDPRRAIAEVWRVLRPGGTLLLVEHVRSPLRVVRRIQQILEPTLVRVAGDYLTREPLEFLAGSGFAVDEVQRSRLGIIERACAHKPVAVSC